MSIHQTYLPRGHHQWSPITTQKPFLAFRHHLLGLHPLVLEQDPLGALGQRQVSLHWEVKDKHPSETVSHVQLSDLRPT